MAAGDRQGVGPTDSSKEPMKRAKHSPSLARSLPTGRFLYAEPTEEIDPCVVLSRRGHEFWIARAEWNPGCPAAGPYRDHQSLRALRIANTHAPRGCELDVNSWSSGLFLLGETPLPGDLNEWTTVDVRQLPPSVSIYPHRQIAPEPTFEAGCCAPPRDQPKIRWGEGIGKLVADDTLVRIREALQEQHLPAVGHLKHAWNAHPPGSLVFAVSYDLNDQFAIVDVPPPLQELAIGYCVE